MFIIILFGIKQFKKLWNKDISKYSPTVMSRGTPCIYRYKLSDIMID